MTRRIGIQDYDTVAFLQSETYVPRLKDKVYVKSIDNLFKWDAVSVSVEDGTTIIKQTSIVTGRWMKIRNNGEFTLPINTSVSTLSNIRANVASWAFSTVIGKIYKIHIIAGIQTVAVGTGVSIGFITPSGTGNIIGNMTFAVNNGLAASDQNVTIRAISSNNFLVGSFGTSTSVNPINSPHYVGGDLVFTCTASGSFQVQFASEINATQATLLAGSVMIVTQLN